MGFTEAVRSGFNNYATFTGRARRSEYWYWVLFQVLVSIAASVIDTVVGGTGILNAVVGLGLLVPSLAVGVRRLHDIGKSGWNLLWALIPILGGLYLIYLYVQPSSPEANAYGPAPGFGAPATS